MKNKFLLLLILGVAFFAGCNNDDDDDNALVGTWNLAPVELNDGGSFVSGPIEIKWEAGEDAQLVNYVPVIEGVAGALLPQVLKDITFKKNNQIVATYSDAGISLDSDSLVEPNWKVSEAKYLKYKVVSDNQLQLYLNVENILKEVGDIDMTSMSAQLDAEDLPKLMSFVTKVSKEGVAASYVLSENLDKLTITLEKALFDQIMPLLPVFVKLIPADNDAMLEIIPEIVEQLQAEWAMTTAFGISLKLEK